ncbi:hypothetical protein [Absidia glauca]|uniref:Uncharacterized protein n=1 Tax=Absidia glauca TaxID=4829 RepID=A0A168MIM9_ABSGL|nr:hypothetical protein [Absidia glauca]
MLTGLCRLWTYVLIKCLLVSQTVHGYAIRVSSHVGLRRNSSQRRFCWKDYLSGKAGGELSDVDRLMSSVDVRAHQLSLGVADGPWIRNPGFLHCLDSPKQSNDSFQARWFSANVKDGLQCLTFRRTPLNSTPSINFGQR